MFHVKQKGVKQGVKRAGGQCTGRKDGPARSLAGPSGVKHNNYYTVTK